MPLLLVSTSFGCYSRITCAVEYVFLATLRRTILPPQGIFLSKILFFYNDICLGHKEFSVTFYIFSITVKHPEILEFQCSPSLFFSVAYFPLNEGKIILEALLNWYILTHLWREIWADVPFPVQVYSRLGLRWHFHVVNRVPGCFTISSCLEFRQPTFYILQCFEKYHPKLHTHSV